MTTSLPKIMFIRDRPIQINCMSVAYNFGSNLLRNMKERLRIFLSFNWYFRLAFDGRRLTGGGTVFRPDDYPREGGRDLRSKDRPKDRRGGGKGRRYLVILLSCYLVRNCLCHSSHFCWAG